jgi:hypothetical protein
MVKFTGRPSDVDVSSTRSSAIASLLRQAIAERKRHAIES